MNDQFPGSKEKIPIGKKRKAGCWLSATRDIEKGPEIISIPNLHDPVECQVLRVQMLGNSQHETFNRRVKFFQLSMGTLPQSRR
jgi:hypothetical protein